MSTASYEQMMVEKKWIERQTDAEFAFAKSLEAQGVDPIQFMKQWKLSHHQFNTLAHYIHGVHDEEPILPPALQVLLGALETRRAA
jgi:LPS sulfotransferase NodH